MEDRLTLVTHVCNFYLVSSVNMDIDLGGAGRLRVPNPMGNDLFGKALVVLVIVIILIALFQKREEFFGWMWMPSGCGAGCGCPRCQRRRRRRRMCRRCGKVCKCGMACQCGATGRCVCSKPSCVCS